MHIERLLLATDFSVQARKALGYAAELSGRLRAPLLVLSCFQLPVYPLPEGMISPSGETLGHMLDRVTDDLAAEAKIARGLGAYELSTLVVEGIPAEEIVRAAREKDIDLIVVGSHGRRPLARAILGSTADKVMRTAPCPVMVVVHGDFPDEDGKEAG
ncbi:MAG TPA: universal stress protein [Kofleriaceae bacterium]|nr:universal stress protein [Kofleriaceae bacterium]